MSHELNGIEAKQADVPRSCVCANGLNGIVRRGVSTVTRIVFAEKHLCDITD